MKKIRHKHPLAIRWLHWINFPILLAMVWSGLLIYWANAVYKVGWGDTTILKFFPDSFNKALKIPYRLAEGMSIHFFFMWLFAINGLIYVLYLLFSKEWKSIIPNRQSWPGAWITLKNSLRFRKENRQSDKYNGAQRIAYTGTIIMGFIMVLNGLAIYKPVQFNWLCAMFGGYANARMIHFTITILFCLFFMVHVIQVVAHGFNHFRAMITGFEVMEDDVKVDNKNQQNEPITTKQV